MKEFIDKLISRLEEAKVSANRRNAFDSEVSYACAIDIVNKLAEEYKDKSSIIDDLKAFLKEKFNYNSEQAEIWADGSDTDSYFRQQKDLYMDRANIYGEVMRELDRLSEEYNVSEMPTGWIPCSERLPNKEECGAFGSKEFQVTIPQRDGNKTISMHFAYETVRGKEVARWKWRGSLSSWKVIAWKPLDAPYTEGE